MVSILEQFDLVPETKNRLDSAKGQTYNVGDVLLFRKSDKIDMFGEMWFHIFLWMLVSHVMFHLVAVAVALCQLRQHSWWKYMLIPFIANMLIVPFTIGAITSAFISWVYSISSFTMPQVYAVAIGLGQTLFLIFCNLMQ